MASADDTHHLLHSGRSPFTTSTSTNASTSAATLRPLFEPDPKFASAHRSVRKSANVWFAPPVPSPLLSPAREKGLQIVKKNSRQRSIFSAQPRGKGLIEAEEPTSPKVSCIGQVKSCRKTKSAPTETISQHSKSGSASPARFFTSPSLHSKWASFFGSRKASSGSSDGVPEDHKPRIWDSAFPSNTCSLDGGASCSPSDVLPHDDGDTHSVSKLPGRIHKPFDKVNEAAIPDHIREPDGAKLKSTYEQLPPLQSVSCETQNLKISLEVVPETWLWRGGERLNDYGGPIPDEVKAIRRSEAGRPPRAEIATLGTSSHDGTGHSFDYHDNSFLPATCSDSTNAIKQSTVVPVDGNSCKRLRDWFKEMDKDSCLYHASQQGIVEASQERPGASFHGKRTQIHAEPNEFSQMPPDMERDRNGTMNDVLEEKHDENFDKRNFKFPDFYGGHKPGNKSKSKKREPANSFSAVILVGYNLNEDAESKIASCKNLLKGALEVGRLSLHGTGNYLQLLNSEAEFIRSRSATSHRTVIRLQRCNSEPCKPSKL